MSLQFYNPPIKLQSVVKRLVDRDCKPLADGFGLDVKYLVLRVAGRGDVDQTRRVDVGGIDSIFGHTGGQAGFAGGGVGGNGGGGRRHLRGGIVSRDDQLISG